jgi:hypothetical protein
MDPRIRIHPKMSWIRNTAIRKCLQSLNYVFKLIVASRQLFARATGGQNQEGFRSEVHLLFKSFNRMLSYQSDQVGAQCAEATMFFQMYRYCILTTLWKTEEKKVPVDTFKASIC